MSHLAVTFDNDAKEEHDTRCDWERKVHDFGCLWVFCVKLFLGDTSGCVQVYDQVIGTLTQASTFMQVKPWIADRAQRILKIANRAVIHAECACRSVGYLVQRADIDAIILFHEIIAGTRKTKCFIETRSAFSRAWRAFAASCVSAFRARAALAVDELSVWAG